MKGDEIINYMVAEACEIRNATVKTGKHKRTLRASERRKLEDLRKNYARAAARFEGIESSLEEDMTRDEDTQVFATGYEWVTPNSEFEEMLEESGDG